MYRDDAEAARLRNLSLEAKLAERDAALAARDAEFAELRVNAARLGDAPPSPPPSRRRVQAGLILCAACQ